VAALGTDTGGSIRIPAALCGVVGLKPNVWPASACMGFFFRWLRASIMLGPLARSVADAAVLLAAIAGRDPRDPTSVARPRGDLLGV